MNNSRHYVDYESAASARIDEIMDGFNFHKVRRTMRALNWMWSGGGDPSVPEESELRGAARKMLREAARRHCGAASGGFVVTFREGVDEGVKFFMLDLLFAVADSFDDGVSYAS